MDTSQASYTALDSPPQTPPPTSPYLSQQQEHGQQASQAPSTPSAPFQPVYTPQQFYNPPPQGYPQQQQQGETQHHHYIHPPAFIPFQQYAPQYYTQPQYIAPPPQQGYTPQGYPLQQVYTQTAGQPPMTVFVATEPADIADIPFVHTSDSYCTQLGKIPGYMWLSVTRTHAQTSGVIKVHASWFVVIVIVILQAIINAGLAVGFYEIGNDGTPLNGHAGMLAWTAVVSIPVFFFLRGLIYGLSKCIGRRHPELAAHPKFMQLCFVSILFAFPLDIMGTLASWIPFVGFLVALFIYIYHLVLLTMAIRGVFHLSRGQAAGVIIVFILLVVIFSILLILLSPITFTIIAGLGSV